MAVVSAASDKGVSAVNVFACDAGSQSFKAALYDLESEATDASPAGEPIWDGDITWSRAGSQALMRERWSGGQARVSNIVLESFHRAPDRLLNAAVSAPRTHEDWQHRVKGVVHRVVHAGGGSLETAVVDAPLKQAISVASQLAPGHNPIALAAIDAAERIFDGSATHVAVFDSAFHATLPDAASTYAVPRTWRESWRIRKLGFHGVSHGYCARRVAALVGRDLRTLRIVSCHLGGGSSLAAIEGGRSVDTTMGFTTLDGLVMGERSGSVDPGVIVYLLRRNRYTAEEIAQELNERSGLLGLSGGTSDMRDVIDAAAAGLPAAKLAFDVYIHRLRSGIAAMAASLGGIDALAFTGGVGENSAEVRRAACERLGFLDIAIDAARDAAPAADRDISPSGRKVRVCVVKSEERWELARECARFLTARNVRTT